METRAIAKSGKTIGDEITMSLRPKKNKQEKMKIPKERKFMVVGSKHPTYFDQKLMRVFKGKGAIKRANKYRDKLRLEGYSTSVYSNDGFSTIGVYGGKTKESARLGALAKTSLLGVPKTRKYKEGTFELYGTNRGLNQNHGFANKKRAEQVKDKLVHRGWGKSQIKVVPVKNQFGVKVYGLYIWGNLSSFGIDTGELHSLYRS